MEHNEKVEIYDDDNVVTLYDDADKPVDFYEVASVEYEGEFYSLLEPCEEMEGINEGEVLIFKTLEENDELTYQPVDDEKILQAVFDEYLDAASCDDDCCDCHCDCHCDCCEEE